MTPTPRRKAASGDSGRLGVADQHKLADQPPAAGHAIEPMLSLDDLAALLNVSRRWLERERSAGRVPKPDFQAGRCPRWKPATIRGWIETGGRA